MPIITATPNTSTTGSVTIENKSSFSVTGATIGKTETTIVIPSGTKAFKLQAANSAGAAVLTLSDVATGTSSATTSFDIYAGSSYEEEFLTGTSSLTIYIKSSKVSTPVQVLLWS